MIRPGLLAVVLAVLAAAAVVAPQAAGQPFGKQGKSGKPDTKLTPAEEEAKAVEAVITLGGRIVRAGEGARAPVVEVTLAGSKAGDFSLKDLAPLKQLKVLTLAGTGISDYGLRNLTGFKYLERLRLDKTA